MIRITELEETITTLSQKINNVEKQKSRLSQEIEIMIMDLEKVLDSSISFQIGNNVSFFFRRTPLLAN